MAATISYSTTIKIGPVGAADAYASPTAIAAIGEITSLSFDGVAQSSLEVTSISDAVKKYKAGILDPGSISIELNLDYDDAQQVALATASTDRLLRSYLISFGAASTGGMTVSGVGIITGFSVKAANDTVLTASFTIKCSAAYALTAI